MPQMTTIIPGFLIILGALFGGIIASNFAKLVILAKVAQYYRSSLEVGSEDYVLVPENKLIRAEIVPSYECYFWACVTAIAFPCISLEYEYPASVLIILALSVLVVMSFVDYAVRIAPFELTVVFYLLAIFYAISAYSFQSFVAVFTIASLSFVFLKAANKIADFMDRDVPIGNGDVRIIPACVIMLGSLGTLTMLFAMAILPMLWIIIKLIMSENISLKDKIPLIPYLTLGFIAGLFPSIPLGLTLGGV